VCRQTHGPPRPIAAHRQKGSAIHSNLRVQQGDLVAALLGRLDRNRLALVMLAASLAAGARGRAAGARTRAREAYTESVAARWLARHAEAVRAFLIALSALDDCTAQAGYRALDRARPTRRLSAAPRRIGVAAAIHTPLAAPVIRGPDRSGLLTFAVRP
jgi:hypothetical protein